MAFLLLHNLLSIGNLHVSTSESQQDIDESFKQKFMKYGGSVPKQKGIANALVHFIADTMSPLSVVENSHLKLFELIRSKIWTTILKTKHLSKVYTESEHKLNDHIILLKLPA